MIEVSIRFCVNVERTHLLAQILRRLQYIPDTFDDWTPFKGDRYREMHFLFFLTCIDHNTHGSERYEAVIEGESFHGSELMYYLARQAASSDPDLFTPARMKDLADEAVRDIFTAPGGQIPAGIEERGELLRDAATILCARYGCDLANLFREGRGRLRRADGRGVLDLLREVKGFSDPLEKKSFLLVKLLRRRGAITVADPAALNVPIDHVLFTLALRSGLVEPDRTIQDDILERRPLSEEIVAELRRAGLKAFKELALHSSIPVDILDDLFWAYGRECLRFAPPFPEENTDEIVETVCKHIGDKGALKEFILFINGLDSGSPDRPRLYPVPSFSPNRYF
ncbi:queuosine salvage family protein [Geomonas sp. RF6]|uniref:queuosine salvage family protein n=1 Tax=Geomonas sp. RF6 TaxID=2897342 RepID=UPI001E4BB61C|nr:queuosine salvage family protein [Geomonas sp. RF6]UFS70242.1 queuosine salvage family protein [Geomonas sp. RF6]